MLTDCRDTPPSRRGGKKSRKGGKKSRRGGRRKTRRGGSVANKVSDAVGGLLSDLEHPTLKFLPASLYGGAKKGSKSKTRPGHEDYETYMGSKRYSEKMLKQLTGRRTMSAPDFPYMGGRPTGSKKGAKSRTRPGHEDYETDMNSKVPPIQVSSIICGAAVNGAKLRVFSMVFQ